MKIDCSDCTILVCSCDAYEDTWEPFFVLFKKYWPDCSMEILLNTESKQYVADGLNIRCLQKYQDQTVPYGERMIAHLKEIQTPFTLVLMDDYFLRRTVDEDEICRVINWMKEDPRAVVFHLRESEDVRNRASDRYSGYDLRPVCGRFKYNFQAAVWRTEYLQRSWKAHETPWEWEGVGNYRSFTKNYDFYTIQKREVPPIDYGFQHWPWGIVKGKWAVESVDGLFRTNNIHIDYLIRGIYKEEEEITPRIGVHTRWIMEFRGLKSLGVIGYTKSLLWRISGRLESPYWREFVQKLYSR